MTRATVKTYNSIDERPEEKPRLKDYISKTEYNLPPPFNKRDKISEKEILAEIIRKLQHNRIFHVRLSLGGVIRNTKAGAILTANSMVGWSDILCVCQGKLITLEVKRFGGHVTSQQLSVMKEINANGGKAVIICSATNLGKVFTNEISNYFLEGVQVW